MAFTGELSGADVSLDATGFAGNLTSTTTDVQRLAAAVDALPTGGSWAFIASSTLTTNADVKLVDTFANYTEVRLTCWLANHNDGGGDSITLSPGLPSFVPLDVLSKVPPPIGVFYFKASSDGHLYVRKTSLGNLDCYADRVLAMSCTKLPLPIAATRGQYEIGFVDGYALALTRVRTCGVVEESSQPCLACGRRGHRDHPGDLHCSTCHFRGQSGIDGQSERTDASLGYPMVAPQLRNAQHNRKSGLRDAK